MSIPVICPPWLTLLNRFTWICRAITNGRRQNGRSAQSEESSARSRTSDPIEYWERIYLAELLEPIRQFWAAFPLVRELGDEQRERFGVDRKSTRLNSSHQLI